MGACASVPKGMRAKAGEAPAPEPAKEESVKGASVETIEKVNIEEDKKNDDEAKQQSLGLLLNEVDDKKEAIDEKKTIDVVPLKPKEAEANSKEAPTTPKKINEMEEMEEEEKVKEEKQGN